MVDLLVATGQSHKPHSSSQGQFLRSLAVAAPLASLGASIPASTKEIFMACTITSLILFAMFGVIAVGFAKLAKHGRSQVREEKDSNSLGGPVIA
jgi:hypothetical protein